MSKLEPGSPEWQRLVTPSKIAGILGVSPWTDPYTTWHRMAGNLEPEPETDAMRRGTFHEGALLREYAHRHPDRTIRVQSTDTIRVSEWLAVTPDAVTTPTAPVDGADDGREVLEIKTTESWDEWGTPGTDEIPEQYVAQVIVLAHVLGISRWTVFVCGPFWDYREYHGAADPELAEAILEECHGFWISARDGEEPELDASPSAYTTWTKVTDPAAGEGEVQIDPELAARFWTAYEATQSIDGIKAQIVNELDRVGAKVAKVGKVTVAQRQRNSHGGASLVVGRKRFDPAELLTMNTEGNPA